MNKARRTLILADRTLKNGSTLRHLDIAARLGYDAVSLRVAPSLDCRAYVPPGSALMKEVKQRLVDTGLTVWDAESARINATFSVQDFLPCLEAAGELGAQYFVTVGDDTDTARVADNLAALIAAAKPFAVRIAMEFMAYIGIGSLQRVAGLLDAVHSTDAAILIDALHLARSGATPADLRTVDASRLAYCQLCDAPARAPTDAGALREEARLNRMIPGEGDLPLVDLLRAMPHDAAIAVEVPSHRLSASLGDEELAARCLKATRTLMAAAQGSPA